MFFVGATGQLLTLLLSVGLPMVILLSGNKSFTLTDSFSGIFIEKESDNSIEATDCFKLSEVTEEKIVQEHEFTPYCSPPIKIKSKNFTPLKVFRGFKGLGNKAPPTLI